VNRCARCTESHGHHLSPSVAARPVSTALLSLPGPAPRSPCDRAVLGRAERHQLVHPLIAHAVSNDICPSWKELLISAHLATPPRSHALRRVKSSIGRPDPFRHPVTTAMAGTGRANPITFSLPLFDLCSIPYISPGCAQFPRSPVRAIRNPCSTGPSPPSTLPTRHSTPRSCTWSVRTLKLTSVLGPKALLMGTSAASRPHAINTLPMRGILLRASNVYHRPSR